MHLKGQSNPAIFSKTKNHEAGPPNPLLIPTLHFFLANYQTNLRSSMGRKLFGDWIARCPDHLSLAGQNRPATPSASGNTRLEEQAF
jgi:hypothetical protein